MLGHTLLSRQSPDSFVLEHDALPLFAAAMWRAVLPLTLVTVAVLAWRALRGAGRGEEPTP